MSTADHDELVCDGLSSHDSGRSTRLPIDLVKADKVICNTCGRTAASDNPLTSPTVAAQFGHTRPWAKYRIVKDANEVPCSRVPTGKACAICLNCFSACGLVDTYENTQGFCQPHVQAGNADQGRHFVTMTQQLIKETTMTTMEG